MKIRHMLLNVLPLPLWIAYYLITLPTKEQFIINIDENVYLLIIILFTIYNLFSIGAVEFLMRNLISVTSLTAGVLISGQIYIKSCYHMSDVHYTVTSMLFDNLIRSLFITAVACTVSYCITKKRKQK